MGEFTPHDRVELVNTTDAHTRLKPGDLGTIMAVDDLGTVHIRWDNGSRLGMSIQDGDIITVLPTSAADSDVVTPAHLNPDCVEGTAILALYDRIKQLEDEDSEGGCNGGDFVALVEDFFRGLGVDTDLPTETVRERLRSQPRTYTVLGLRDNTATGEMFIAGVVRGDVHTAENVSSDRMQRVRVQAIDAKQAEALARQRFDADLLD